MAFVLPKKCRPFFSQIFDAKNKSGTKLRLFFDEYYYSLMVGLAAEKYDEDAELENSEITDAYPAEYADCRDYIAALLFATERRRRGIPEGDAAALERLMTEYIDPTSKTHLSGEGEKRLNQYAAMGMEIMVDVMNRPVRLDEFLLEYLECFRSGRFMEE